MSPTTEFVNVSEKKVSESSSTTVPGICSTTDTTPTTVMKNVSDYSSNTAPGTCSTTVAAAASSPSSTTDPTDAKLDALLSMVNLLKSQNETKKGFPPTNSTTTSSSTTNSTDNKLDALMNMFNVLKSEPESQKGLPPTNSTVNTYPRSKIEQMAPHVKQNDFSVDSSTTASVTKEDFEHFKSEMRSLSARESERFPTSAQSMPGMYLHDFLFIQKRFYIVLTNFYFTYTGSIISYQKNIHSPYDATYDRPTPPPPYHPPYFPYLPTTVHHPHYLSNARTSTSLPQVNDAFSKVECDF